MGEARHPLQQRRHLSGPGRLRPRDRRGNMGPRHARQFEGRLLRLQVRDSRDAPRGRRVDREHGVVRRAGRGRDAPDRLHREQGRRARDDARDRGRVRAQGHSRQRPLPRSCGYAALEGALLRSGPPGAPHGAHPARAAGAGQGDCPGGPFPRLGRVLLRQRRDVHRRRGNHGRVRDPGVARPVPSREELQRRDEEELSKLGYTQQLLREMGGFSNLASSFSVISILTGAVLLFGYGLKFAGPIMNTAGWPIVSLVALVVAASRAELASLYPTAGGLYFWAFRLGGRGPAFTTAWLNMVGQVTITAGIDIAAAIYLIGTATRLLGLPPDAKLPVFGAVTGWSFQLFAMVLIMIPQVAINVFGIRWTARLNDFSVWWHIAGGALIVLLLVFLGTHHNRRDFLTRYAPAVTPLQASSAPLPGGRVAPAVVVGSRAFPSPLFALFPSLAAFYAAGPFALAFVLGLLQAQWTYTGYDASAHVAEET